jgi:soluble lytic murein transglycosylase
MNGRMRGRTIRWFRVCAVAAAVAAGLGAGAWRWWTHRFDVEIREAAALYGVDPELLRAIIRRESGFRATVLGDKGEAGLMQVTERAASEWADDVGRPPPTSRHLLDPRMNLHAGAWYIARALRNWAERPDPLPYALAEYNAGRSNAERWARGASTSAEFIDRITYPSTRMYVLDIVSGYRGKAGGAGEAP